MYISIGTFFLLVPAVLSHGREGDESTGKRVGGFWVGASAERGTGAEAQQKPRLPRFILLQASWAATGASTSRCRPCPRGGGGYCGPFWGLSQGFVYVREVRPGRPQPCPGEDCPSSTARRACRAARWVSAGDAPSRGACTWGEGPFIPDSPGRGSREKTRGSRPSSVPHIPKREGSGAWRGEPELLMDAGVGGLLPVGMSSRGSPSPAQQQLPGRVGAEGWGQDRPRALMVGTAVRSWTAQGKRGCVPSAPGSARTPFQPPPVHPQYSVPPCSDFPEE